MIDQRIGIALDKDTHDALTQFCKKNKVSKSMFISAMISELPQNLLAETVSKHKSKREKNEQVRKVLAKRVMDKISNLSDEDIARILAKGDSSAAHT